MKPGTTTPVSSRRRGPETITIEELLGRSRRRRRAPARVKAASRVLGVDTSLRSTGVGVVERKASRFAAVEYGILKMSPAFPVSECLRRLSDGLAEIIERTRPDAVAIEGIFFCKNVRTAVVLGEARGVVIAACAARGLPVYEYAPRRVKQAVVGFGGAGKEQVQKMIRALLALSETPKEDAADALAIALCHLHSSTGHAALMPESL